MEQTLSGTWPIVTGKEKRECSKSDTKPYILNQELTYAISVDIPLAEQVI